MTKRPVKVVNASHLGHTTTQLVHLNTDDLVIVNIPIYYKNTLNRLKLFQMCYVSKVHVVTRTQLSVYIQEINELITVNKSSGLVFGNKAYVQVYTEQRYNRLLEREIEFFKDRFVPEAIKQSQIVTSVL